MLQTSTTLRYWLQTRWFQLYALWKFSRPHTIIGTTLSVIALWSLAGAEVLDWQISLLKPETATLPTGLTLIALVVAWLACLCGNVYIVGLNQLEDQAIDRINKPQLPLVSGELSVVQGRWIVAIAGILALLLAFSQGQWLALTVASSLLIGTAYSLPPIRLKRFPFWASLCILSVRGLIVNLGLFLHFSQRFQQVSIIPIQVWLLTIFILIFSIAIAIFKDIPDAEGDRQFKISTLTLKLGPMTVFNVTRGILTIAYVGMGISATLWLRGSSFYWALIAHFLILSFFWIKSLTFVNTVNLQSSSKYRHEITSFYQFIWKLFFLEYLLIPIFALSH